LTSVTVFESFSLEKATGTHVRSVGAKLDSAGIAMTQMWKL